MIRNTVISGENTVPFITNCSSTILKTKLYSPSLMICQLFGIYHNWYHYIQIPKVIMYLIISQKLNCNRNIEREDIIGYKKLSQIVQGIINNIMINLYIYENAFSIMYP